MTTVERPRLTALSHGAGCGCKLPAAELLPLVARLHSEDPRLLVGPSTADDAAVFEIEPGLALVQTVDFFTPVVDDPFDFGRIAAANALSDVYAMGGRPLTALGIVCWPLALLGREPLAELIAGGEAVVSEAGALLAGGHSIDDPEPKFGLAVTGVVDRDAMLTNAGGRPGDVLVLTKPLGAGAIVTAAKRGMPGAHDAALTAAIDVMTQLNAAAGAAAVAAGARAATDVTGFGLLGHLHNLARESGLAAEIEAAAVPALPAALELLADESAVSGGSRSNRALADTFTDWGPPVGETERRLLTDATTSGGLLVALPAAAAGAIAGTVVGRLVEGPAGTIAVR